VKKRNAQKILEQIERHCIALHLKLSQATTIKCLATFKQVGIQP
jgi:hypothetical protein